LGVELNVTLFRNFTEDRRLSMDGYADGLTRAYQNYFPKLFQVHEFQPHNFSWLGEGVWSMRIARFVFYPLEVRGQQREVNHILDHGYGHLLYVLDPQRTVVTVHDLIPLLRWKGKITGESKGRKPWLNLIAFNVLCRSRHIIANSENTKSDLINHLGCSAKRITVIYYGVDSIFKPYGPEEKKVARNKWNLPDNGTRRLLIIGSQFYKNQTGAIKVFERLNHLYHDPLELIKVGPADSLWVKLMQESDFRNKIICLGAVPHAELPGLYNIVDCLLFPSLYEGFGWPPLEAMACGTPVVASNTASLPEVIGDAGLMCAPQDHEALAQAMYAVLTNDALRQVLIKRGLARARQFTWEQTAQQTLLVYEQVIREQKNADWH
jgi:glycosyltransferase involved in cell wall biosynthesis